MRVYPYAMGALLAVAVAGGGRAWAGEGGSAEIAAHDWLKLSALPSTDFYSKYASGRRGAKGSCRPNRKTPPPQADAESGFPVAPHAP